MEPRYACGGARRQKRRSGQERHCAGSVSRNPHDECARCRRRLAAERTIQSFRKTPRESPTGSRAQTSPTRTRRDLHFECGENLRLVDGTRAVQNASRWYRNCYRQRAHAGIHVVILLDARSREASRHCDQAQALRRSNARACHRDQGPNTTACMMRPGRKVNSPAITRAPMNRPSMPRRCRSTL